MPDGARFTYRFTGRIVISNADSVRSEIETQVAGKRFEKLVFDMQAVTECDSYGLKLLIDFHRRAEAEKKQLLLYRPSESLHELLKITKLDEVLRISQTGE
jgi:anti-anti-sigma factor